MTKTKITAVIGAVVLILLDQAAKIWALLLLKPVFSIPVIKGLFNLTYVENRGAAFGIFQGNTLILSCITGIAIFAALLYVFFGKINDKFSIYTIMLIIAGGMGNLYDRIFRGFVVDYFDFSALFGFPVFNIADCCVVIGTILLLIKLLYQENEARKQANL